MRNVWRFGYLDFDLEMWRYARELKVVSQDPLIGLEHRPNGEAHLMGVRVRTDAFGFRRADDVTEERRPEKAQSILVAGDSETLGWGVPEGETYSDILQRALPQYRIHNSGVGNTNTSMEVNLLKANLDRMKPSLVILGYSLNDAEPDLDLTNISPLKNLALGLALIQIYQLSFGKKTNYIDYNRELYQESSETWIKWKLAVDELAKLGRDRSLPITALLIPELHQPFMHGPFKDVYEKVARYFTDRGIEVIDPSQDFPSGDGSMYWVTPLDPHPNAKAQQILAAALLRAKHIDHLRSLFSSNARSKRSATN